MKSKSQSGSVLVVAAAFALLIAACSAAYIFLALGVYKRNARSFYYNSAANLAETGLERGLWALNNSDWTKTLGTGPSPTAWTQSGSSNKIWAGNAANAEFTDLNGMSGYCNVLVENYNTTTPTLTAEAVIQLPTGAAIRKQVRLYTTQTTFFFPPVAAINDLTLKGGIYDSYRMADGPNTSTHRYNTTIASLSISLGDALLNSNATIYGTVETGVDSSGSSTFVNAVKGSVLASDTVSGGSGVVRVGSNLVDTNQISYDFDQSYPDPYYPTDYGSVVSGTQANLPVDATTGKITLGTPNATSPTMYDITGNVNADTIVVVGPAYLKVSGTLTLTGNDGINVYKAPTTVTVGNGANAISYSYNGSTTAKIGIYVTGDVSITGNGAVSTNDPTAISLYGMNSTAGVQNINLGGNGSFVGTLYAPNANVTFNGGGTNGYLAGAVVGYNITVTGSHYNIRYPEELKNLLTGQTFKLAKWVELTNPSDWHTF